MFVLKKLGFKFLELGLGLRTCFSLETRNPIFVNFRLTDPEAASVERALPAGYKLRSLRFFQNDPSPARWISYNLYGLKYPKKELAHVVKSRCEINTFVEDPAGRKGVFVFSGSPYVSQETGGDRMGKVCDAAERLVIGIYGCGRLIPLRYEVGASAVDITFAEGDNRVTAHFDAPRAPALDRLSDDYWTFNDLSFFNGGKTYDEVNVNSAFFAARFERWPVAAGTPPFESAFLRRAPDEVYLHRGEIGYLVNAMNRSPQ